MKNSASESKPFQSRDQRRNSQPRQAKRKAEPFEIETRVPNWFMTLNFSCTLFNVSGSAHEKLGVMSRFDNVLFINVLSRFANVLGQFPNFYRLISG